MKPDGPRRMGLTDPCPSADERQAQWKQNPGARRIPEDMRINQDLLYKGMTCSSHFGIHKEDSNKEKTFTPRKRDHPSTTIKTPISSLTKVCIIYPSLAVQSCENGSNLTFGGYLAGTKPVLSIRSFLSFFCTGDSFECQNRVTHW